MYRVFSRDGKTVLAWDGGEHEFAGLTATRVGYALMECARFEASTPPGDPKRTKVWEFTDALLPTPRFGDPGGGSRMQGDDRPAGDEALCGRNPPRAPIGRPNG
jgi:hypothetical protein